MVDITAKVITDSIGEHSPRLTTFLTRYPKFVHAEHCRHRAMSLCVSSSRAVPVAKNLEEVRSDELRAGPVYWGAEQKGMQSGAELSSTGSNGSFMYSDKNYAQMLWREAALRAADYAERLKDRDVHKSIVNRLLEPFLHVNVLVTCAEPGLLNFFGLRLDIAAQPEIRVLAEAMWAAWNESTPRKLAPGEWHLPFVDPALIINQDDDYAPHAGQDSSVQGLRRIEVFQRISTARCARLSYTSFETGRRSTIEEDLKLYDRLVGAHPIHASPAEHQATPDVLDHYVESASNPEWNKTAWKHPELHGNLPGWVQHRKTLPGEACAPLPEGYEYVRRN